MCLSSCPITIVALLSWAPWWSKEDLFKSWLRPLLFWHRHAVEDNEPKAWVALSGLQLACYRDCLRMFCNSFYINGIDD
jgi:hypothetical protein